MYASTATKRWSQSVPDKSSQLLRLQSKSGSICSNDEQDLLLLYQRRAEHHHNYAYITAGGAGRQQGSRVPGSLLPQV